MMMMRLESTSKLEIKQAKTTAMIRPQAVEHVKSLWKPVLFTWEEWWDLSLKTAVDLFWHKRKYFRCEISIKMRKTKGFHNNNQCYLQKRIFLIYSFLSWSLMAFLGACMQETCLSKWIQNMDLKMIKMLRKERPIEKSVENNIYIL